VNNVYRITYIDIDINACIAFELSRNSDPAGVGAGENSKSPLGLFKKAMMNQCTAFFSLEDQKIGSVLSFMGVAMSEPRMRPISRSININRVIVHVLSGTN
jgi:hypothetical protein